MKDNTDKEMAKMDIKLEIDSLKELLSLARWLNSRLQNQIDNIESYNRLVDEMHERQDW
jgi:hypothetical protein